MAEEPGADRTGEGAGEGAGAVAGGPVGELYALPLDQFTKERNALAKRLRAEGDKEAAAWIAKLRKPSAAAWAVNQVARRHRGEVARYLDAAARVRVAMAGEGDVREAAERLRDVEAGVRRAAVELAGANRATEVNALLAAAAADEQVGERLRAGRVVGDEADDAPLAAFAPGGGGTKGMRPATDEVDAARRKRAREEAARLAREAERAEDDAERLERDAAEAEEQATAAAERAERARAKADAAREKAAAARARADEAADDDRGGRGKGGAAGRSEGKAQTKPENEGNGEGGGKGTGTGTGMGTGTGTGTGTGKGTGTGTRTGKGTGAGEPGGGRRG